MFQIKTIIVPTDFSSASLQALSYATEFAKVHEAGILLLHTMEPPVYPVVFGVAPVVAPTLESDLLDLCEQNLEKIRAEHIDAAIKVETVVREGPPFLEIVRCAKERSADLIVIATHGHTGLKHVLLGSTAEKVVREAPCPVLTVRAQ